MTRYHKGTTRQFKKDLRRLEKSGFVLSKLQSIIDALASNKALPERCRDHELKSELKGIRECHIAPDWLLTYKKDNDKLILLLLRTGTHRDVLGVE